MPHCFFPKAYLFRNLEIRLGFHTFVKHTNTESVVYSR